MVCSICLTTRYIYLYTTNPRVLFGNCYAVKSLASKPNIEIFAMLQYFVILHKIMLHFTTQPSR